MTCKNFSLRFLSVLTSLILVFSTIGNALILSLADANVWSGGTTAPTIGSGSNTDPFIISSADELAYIISEGGNGNHYKLNADIYLNSVDKINWTTGQSSLGYLPREWYTSENSEPFYGSIDGDGHIIYGLYINKDASVFGGLIPEIAADQTISIKNLGVESSYVYTKDVAAALIGCGIYDNSVEITNCFVGENVMVKGDIAAAFLGCSGGKYNIKNCYSLASVAGDSHYGMIGDTWGSKAVVENSYVVNTIVTSKYQNSASCTNVYVKDSTGANGAIVVDTESMKGLDVLTNEGKMPLLMESGAFEPTESYPMLKIFIDEDVDNDTDNDIEVWDGQIADSYASGTGTKEDPYIIENGSQLALAITVNNAEGAYFKLNSDIYLNKINKINWNDGIVSFGYSPQKWFTSENSDPFYGSIDGDGHVIYGLYINENSAVFGGLIPEVVADGTVTIENLGIESSYISTKDVSAALVGCGIYENTVNITNCYVSDTVTVKGDTAGTFLGCSGGKFTIKESYSRATVAGVSNYGMIGDTWGSLAKIENSYIVNSVVTSKYVNSATCINVYATDPTGGIGAMQLDSENMQGEDVLTNDGKMPLLAECDAFVATDSYPILKVFADVTPDEGDNDNTGDDNTGDDNTGDDNTGGDNIGDDKEDENESGIWDGAAAESFAGGTGTKEDPYIIENASQLALAVTTQNADGAYFKLNKDIYLNNVDKVDWAEGTGKDGYKPKSWYTSENTEPFNGFINGNGHVIYGLYLKKFTSVYGALIPEIGENATVEIKNLGIESSYISTKDVSAALVGCGIYENTVNITNCYVSDTVTVKGDTAASFIGCSGGNFTIKKSFSRAKVSGVANYGMVGDTWGSVAMIEDSYVVDSVITSKYQNSATCINVYTTDVTGGIGAIQLDSANMQGKDALTNEEKMILLADCGAFVATDSYPVLKMFTNIGTEGDEDTEDLPEGEIWSGRIASNFASGTGLENDPYIIENGAQLAYAMKGNGFNGSYFKLSKDIYLNDVTDKKWMTRTDNNVWINALQFNGSIDGNGYIVYGIWQPDDTSSDNSGLISVLREGTIKNIGVRYSYIRATENAGAIVGVTLGGGYKEISGCFSDDTVDIKYTTEAAGGAGGIIGQAGYDVSEEVQLRIENCYSKALIYGHEEGRINGIIGTSWWCSYTISGCYSTGYAPYNATNEDICSYLNKVGVDISEIYSNIYTDGRKPYGLENYVYISEHEEMIGDKAKVSMPGLDFKTVFETVKNSTPKLRIFTSISGEDIDISGDDEVYSSGSGSKTDPFVIDNEVQLRYLLNSKNTKGKYYRLGADIYINDTTKSDWMKNNPEQWFTTENSEAFAGYLEGNGHKVYGLYLNQTPAAYSDHESLGDTGAGLFPKVAATAVIRNLHIRSSYISGKHYVGALVGIIETMDSDLYVQVIGCSADETVTVKGQSVGGLVGGGSSRGLKLYCSYFKGKVDATAEERGNALVGDIWGEDWEMVQCYFLNYPSHRYSNKPNVASGNYGDVAMSSSSYLTLEEMTGEAAKTNMMDFDWEEVWMVVNGNTPQLKVISPDKIIKIYDEGVKGRVWSGYIASAYASGTGSKEDPFIIETPEQMAKLVGFDADTEGKYYRLVADLKLNDTSKSDWEKTAREWLSGTNEFAGHFNGNGYVVSGLYYNTSFANAGLFQYITSGAVIEKVGITAASITNLGKKENGAFAGSLVAMVTGWNLEEFTAPKISECFADHTVEIKSYSTGGLIGGSGRYVHIENCYFAGTLKSVSEGYIGQAIGDLWYDKNPTTIQNSYFISTDGSPLAQNIAASAIENEGVYHKGYRGDVGGAISIGAMLIRGERARTQMPEFDYDNIWKIIDGGTPVLRCFKDAEKYSFTEMPEQVEISFSTAGGSKCESIFGYPLYTELKTEDLPKPEKYGYEFAGWYYFSECDIKVKDGLFPNFNTVFYAKWNPVGFTEGFEGDLSSKYDYNNGAEHFKPGIAGFSPLYVNNGLKSMHIKAQNEINPTFLMSYDNTLEKGVQYDIIFNICTDVGLNDTKTLKLLHANHPQVDSDIVGFETTEIESLAKGRWQKHKVSIVANAPYLLIEVPAGISMYFDDIQVVPTSTNGELGKLETIGNDGSFNWGDIWIYAIIGAGVIIIAISVILILKCRKRK